MIALACAILSSEEVVESDLPCVGRGSVGGDVAPDAFEVFVAPSDHHHGIPSDDTVEAGFKVQIAGIGALGFRMDSVHVRRMNDVDLNACILSGTNSREQQASCFFLTNLVADRQD